MQSLPEMLVSLWGVHGKVLTVFFYAVFPPCFSGPVGLLAVTRAMVVVATLFPVSHGLATQRRQIRVYTLAVGGHTVRL